MFHTGNENSFDIDSGGPKDHVVCFFFNSDNFFQKLHHLTYIPHFTRKCLKTSENLLYKDWRKKVYKCFVL